MIHIRQVSGGYESNPIIHNMSFSVQKGEFFGIIGPNGSGKSTLLKMMSQILPVQTGEIIIANRAMTSYTPKEFARRVAVLPQTNTQTFSYTVWEVVSLGRYAHQSGLFQPMTAKDEVAIEEAMKQTGIQAYEQQIIDHLSGGERQRVFLAQALAQEPDILLLDEPTNHLDLTYQKDLLEVLQKWTKEKHLTVVAIFHDLNLAGLYCDRLLLINQGKREVCDVPENVLEKTRIEAIYQTEVAKHPHPKVARPQMMLMPRVRNSRTSLIIDHRRLEISDDMIKIQSEQPLKTMSTATTCAGICWADLFVIQCVPDERLCSITKTDMENFLIRKNFSLHHTVSMVTSTNGHYLADQFLADGDISIYTVVTITTRSATDTSSNDIQHLKGINSLIFIHGNASDKAFIQAIATATEAKLEALGHINEQVKQNSSDDIVVASTQKGTFLQGARKSTVLGKLIYKGIYECMVKSLKKSNIYEP